MGTQLRRSGIPSAVAGGFRVSVLVLLLGWSNHYRLQAQSPPPYSTGSGSTSIYAFYNPLQTPVAKAPSTPLAHSTQGALPVVNPTQYLIDKGATAPFSQSYFSLPTQIETSPVVSRAPGTPPSPIVAAPTVSFQGIQEAAPQLQPASPDLAVGPVDVLMVVNSAIAQFTKSGTQKSMTAFQDFFSTLLPTLCPSGTQNCQIFDPSVRYDELHGRFLFLATSRTLPPTSNAYLLLSISNGATFDSGWKTWALSVSLDGSTQTANWGDFWRVGYDDVAVYLSGNMYDSSSNFQYGKIRVLKKSDVYNFAATSLPYQDLFNLQNADGSLADSIIPVVQRGKPNNINAQLLVNSTAISVPATYLTIWKIADPTANPLAATRSTVSGLLSYNYPSPAPQLGTTGTLDSGDSRMLKAVYRSGYLYTARDTGYTDVSGAATTVTYDVINTANMSLVSQARLLNTNAFYPSFDVPATTPPGQQFATSSVVTGTTTDSNGQLTHPGISRLKTGDDIFDLTGGSGRNRWGDYFGGAVDPITGGLWASGQYAKTGFTTTPSGFNGQWGTWAGYFPWLTVSLFSDVPSSNAFSDYINVLSMWQITSGCTATTFCPTDLVLQSQIAVYIIRSLFGDPCPNNTSCSTGFTYTVAPYFTDVPSSSPYFPYIQKLRDLGITNGCTATTYCPNNPVTRSAAAVLLVRAKLKGLFGDNFSYNSIPSFTDVSPTTSTFPFIQKLLELGITAGCSTTQFCPDQTLTRQEAAVFVVRAFLN